RSSPPGLGTAHEAEGVAVFASLARKAQLDPLAEHFCLVGLTLHGRHPDAAKPSSVAGKRIRLYPHTLPGLAVAIEVPAHDDRAVEAQGPGPFQRLRLLRGCRCRKGEEQK